MKLTSSSALALCVLAALLGAGCSKSSDTSSSTDSSAAASPAAAASSAAGDASAAPAASAAGSTQTVAAAGDAAHGATIFSANCASCHGANGAGGGIGPVLKGEKTRKDTAAAIAWIKNPQPPMPKLYPSPLSEKDVADVAAYVESL